MASSCTRSSTIEKNCWLSRSLRQRQLSRKGFLALASDLFGTLHADKGDIGKEFAQMSLSRKTYFSLWFYRDFQSRQAALAFFLGDTTADIKR